MGMGLGGKSKRGNYTDIRRFRKFFVARAAENNLSRFESVGERRSALEPVGECGLWNAGRQQSRSGVEPPTGTIHPRQIFATLSNSEKHSRNKSLNLFSILYSSALAWMDHSGRGFNPRPAQGRPAQGRNDPPTLNVRPQFQNRKGITRNESFKLFSAICSSALAWVDRSGRGFNPRPAQGRPASINPDRHSRPAQGRPAQGRNDPPTLNVRPQFQNRKGITRNESSNLFSAICSSALAWVDRSGRGFNPRPAQVGSGRLRFNPSD